MKSEPLVICPQFKSCRKCRHQKPHTKRTYCDNKCLHNLEGASCIPMPKLKYMLIK